MKKEWNRIFVFLFLGVLIMSFFAGVVSAAAEPQSAFLDNIFNILGLKNQTARDTITNIISPTILITLLIFLVIFAVIDRVNIFKGKKKTNLAIAAVIAILATFFIDPSWIAPILNQYTALGITISFVLPFILLFVFVREVVPNNILVQRLLWFIYLAFVAANAALNISKMDSTGKLAWLSYLLYALVIVLSLAMIIFGDKILHKLFMNDIQMLAEQGEAATYARILSQMESDKAICLGGTLTRGPYAALASQVNNKIELLKSVGVIPQSYARIAGTI